MNLKPQQINNIATNTFMENNITKRKLEGLRLAVIGVNKIGMIKAVRDLSPGLGLAEAKNLIETAQNKCSLSVYANETLYETICLALGSQFIPAITDEQFLQILQTAMKQSSAFYMDRLDAVMLCCENLKKMGGLPYAARKFEEFINSI